MSPSPTKQSILLETGTNEVEFLLVTIGGQRYGINVSKVCQIVQFDQSKVSEIPSNFAEMLGILVFRNETISVIDLSMHLKRQTISGVPRLLIVTEFNMRRIGFVVDGVDKIDRASWKEFEPLSGTSASQEGSAILGTVNRPDGLVLILDLESIMAGLDPSMDISECQKNMPSASIKRDAVRILHCEDSPLIQKMVLQALKNGGFVSVQQVGNGKEALELLARGTEGIDVIISDIEMPMIDGLTLCKQLREDRQYDRIPILFFSSLINDQMAVRCKQVGADAAFSKPQLGSIVEKIEDLVAQSRSK